MDTVSHEGDNQKVNSLVFLMCLISLFALPSVGKMVDSRVLFQRERQGGQVRPGPHIIALTLVEIPSLLLVILIYGSISYWMIGLYPSAGHFGFFLLTIGLVIVCSFFLAQGVSAGADSNAFGAALFCAIFVWSLLLGGFLVRRPILPRDIQWIVYTSYFYFGFEALIINEFDNGNSDSQGFLDFRGFHPDDKWVCIGVLVVWIVFWRVLGYILLRFCQTTRRYNAK